ncbi:hypothetical protein CMV_020202 [Castanea mollissima]|uniref:Cytochrome P450 n=1 Tax=Castanea mollissima TaxID=60419 RepID=A0A8J4QWY5_9ROSI|nr:hypothetical protein CMV_020202 [Castanea mollissima]
MDYYLVFLLILPFVWAFIRVVSSNLSSQTLPPGPHPFPIIGNILELGKLPHQAFAKLSKTYGPLMTLKLGSITTIVISSPNMAKEVLQKNDQAFSSRTVPNMAHVFDHHKVSIAWIPANSQWRNLRKACATQIFAPQRLDATEALRLAKVQELVDHVNQSCKSGAPIDIGQVVFTTVLNSISNTLFSIDLAQYDSNLSQEFRDLVCGLAKEAGRPNIADYFPALRMIDPQGVRRRTRNYYSKLLGIFEGIINQRLQLRASSKGSKASNNTLDLLLNLIEEDNSEISLLDIKHLLLDLFHAGIATTSGTCPTQEIQTNFELTVDYYLVFLLILPFVWASIRVLNFKLASQTLPPGSKPFSIIGNILQLSNLPHRALAKLSKTYGPLMTLKLGSITTIVISSPNLAKEALQKNDQAFSSRRIPDKAHVFDRHKFSMRWLPTNSKWKNLRKACATQRFAAQRLHATQGLRHRKEQELPDHVNRSCISGAPIDIGRVVLFTKITIVLTSISNTFSSMDLAQYDSNLSQEFRDIVYGVAEEGGRPNIADYFPALRVIDPQGVRKRTRIFYTKIFGILDGIIKQRLQLRVSSKGSKAGNDVLDLLFSLLEEDNSKISLLDIKNLLMDLFLAGIGTTSSTVEWAMTLPDEMRPEDMDIDKVRIPPTRA